MCKHSKPPTPRSLGYGPSHGTMGNRPHTGGEHRGSALAKKKKNNKKKTTQKTVSFPCV